MITNAMTVFGLVRGFRVGRWVDHDFHRLFASTFRVHSPDLDVTVLSRDV